MRLKGKYCKFSCYFHLSHANLIVCMPILTAFVCLTRFTPPDWTLAISKTPLFGTSRKRFVGLNWDAENLFANVWWFKSLSVIALWSSTIRNDVTENRSGALSTLTNRCCSRGHYGAVICHFKTVWIFDSWSESSELGYIPLHKYCINSLFRFELVPHFSRKSFMPGRHQVKLIKCLLHRKSFVLIISRLRASGPMISFRPCTLPITKHISHSSNIPPGLQTHLLDDNHSGIYANKYAQIRKVICPTTA